MWGEVSVLESGAFLARAAGHGCCERRRMRSRRLFSPLHLLLAVCSAPAAAYAPTASAQGAATDVQVRKPNVLLLIDTSGSMEWTLSGGTSPSVADKARWTTLVETLTGSIQNLSVDASSNTFVASNGCRPVPNLDSGISTSLSTSGASGALGPYAWPKENGNPKDKDAVAFCQTAATNGADCFSTSQWGSAPLCRQGSASDEYHQLADGLIDDFADDVRFGLASFDSIDTIPWNHLTWWSMPGRPLGWLNSAAYGDFQCNTLTDGTRCDIADSELAGTFDSVVPQWSYWHAGNGDSWLNGSRGAYSTDSHRVLFYSFPNLVFGNFGGSTIEAGFRNSRALPTQGRLVGFGPKDYSNVNSIPSNYQIDCNSENTCTEEHNRMVQQVILGLESNLVHSTPLAAMMRDAYEFIVNDDSTRGVHLPHARNRDIGAESELFSEIGPQNDPYFTDSTAPCRSTSVVLVTDGEPSNDLRARAATYARDLLQDADVQTFVVGVGLSQATWDPPGASPVTTVSCDSLTSTDLGANQICEPSGATNWRFADVWPNNAALSGSQRTSIRACCTLLQTAVEGGTNKAFFPSNAAELKQNFSQIINNIAKSPVSRTLPVFAGVTASFKSMSTNAPAVSYEIRSSMNVTGDNSTLWRGNVERVRYACDGSANPILQDIEASRGDDFGRNLLADSTRKRRFFTAIVDEGENMIGSVRRPSVNTFDELFEDDEERGDWHYPDDAASLSWSTMTGMVEVDDIPTAFNGAWGGTDDDLEEVLDPAGSHCSNIGAPNDADCAAWSMLWFAGHPDPDGGAGTDTPSRDPDSPQCEGLCSPLGAIYRTVPVFVPPPQITDSDDQNFARDRGTVSDSFYERYAGRPTMLYAQTIDGMLHAFVVSKNQSTSGPPFGDITVADSLENNELWSFIPPAVMPTIDEAMVANPRTLDGQLAWSNVVYERPANATNTTASPTFNTDVTLWDYQTVIVGCNGNGDAEEGFCYALEITDPLQPKFLWQLSTAGDDDGEPDEPLFGKHVPGAAITHVRIDDGTSDRVVAVAVIPGGHPGGTAPGGHTDRESDKGSNNVTDYWDDPSRTPRKKIRNWSGDQPARSLTFVELRTGRILARMAEDHSDDSPDLKSDVLVDEDNTLFDSPLTGIPAAYPTGLGAVAQRIYVGDADGTMWRVEVNQPDIQKWEAHIAFDGYNKAGTESTLQRAWVPAGDGAGAILNLASTTSDDDAAELGEPIQTAPTLSLDPEGNVVVSFATGDQEAFNTYSAGMVNVLISFVDEFVESKSDADEKETKFQARIDANRGVEFAWRNGGGTTGPLNLFDGQLFFAYFAPSSATNTCTLGTGGICGSHYVDRVSSKPRATGVFGPGADDYCDPFADGEVVFGLAVNQVQSCAITTTSFTDPWLAGTYSAMTEANPGRYELVFQTGQNGAAPAGGGVTKRSALALPQPKSRTQIRSFVRVAEAE
jgi:type IV pilus assembly protein PilY1